MRKINCNKCGEYLGVIRDAKLSKNIEYSCRVCLGGAKKPKYDPDHIQNIFRGIFK